MKPCIVTVLLMRQSSFCQMLAFFREAHVCFGTDLTAKYDLQEILSLDSVYADSCTTYIYNICFINRTYLDISGGQSNNQVMLRARRSLDHPNTPWLV